MVLSQRSLKNLEGVNEDLVQVVHLAIELTPIYFVVTEGLRSVKRHAEIVAAGASRTMNSKHLTGRAVDIAAFPNNKLSWNFNDYKVISKSFKDAADELDIKIRWGGDWRTFKDGPHFELL